MCFTITLKSDLKKTEKRFKAKFAEPKNIKPIFYESAFSLPKHPVILNDNPSSIILGTWGLIPHWVKNPEDAEKIRKQTFNARGETIFEKPSFREQIKKKRCLVLADGFFEWMAYKGKRYPYYIYKKSNEPFAFAGIFDEWTSPETGEILKTFSIITSDANSLLAKIHNTKLRMPVILTEENEKSWLNENLEKDDIEAFLKPYRGKDLEAYTISKMITQRGVERNVPEILKPFDYPELHSTIDM